MKAKIGLNVYGSTLSFNLGARWGWWSTPCPAALPTGKTWHPLYREARWAPEPVCTGAENLAPPLSPGLDPRTVHPLSESLYRLIYPVPH